MKVARPVRRAGRRNPPGESRTRALRLDPYIVGPHHRSAIATLVERQTRYVKLLHLPSLDSSALHAALVDIFGVIPPELRLTLT